MSPEERLLKIIESPHEDADASKDQIKKEGKNDLLAFLDFLGIHAPEGGSLKDKLKVHLTFHSLNTFFIALCVLVTLIWLVDFWRHSGFLTNKLAGIEKRLEESSQDQVSVVESKEDKDMAKAGLTRNVFTLAPVKIEQEVDPTDYNQIVADLKIVGIIWSENPQVMIESKKESKTFLLNNNDKINQLTVKEIKKDKVVLTGEGREWELR